MNIFLTIQALAFVIVVVFAVRSYFIGSEALNDVSERINRCNKNVTMIQLKHEMVEVELIKIQDRFIVLQRELYILKKPTKKKPVDKKKVIKVKAPDISVDAVARGK